MSDLIQAVDSPSEIEFAARRLRETAQQKPTSPQEVLEVFEQWAASLETREFEVPGLAFLRLWLRRGTLEPILVRELGPDSLNGSWREEGQARLRSFPLGVVGHWPAGNIEIQPVLSLTCALLGGNACLVRVPSGLIAATHLMMEKLRQIDGSGFLKERHFIATVYHLR